MQTGSTRFSLLLWLPQKVPKLSEFSLDKRADLCYNTGVGHLYYGENLDENGVRFYSVVVGTFKNKSGKMITANWVQLEPGKVYKFVYNGVTRVALAMEDKGGGNFLCWDFVGGGYRTFYNRNIDAWSDVTHQTKIYPNGSVGQLPKHIRTIEFEDDLYAVNLG
jgi:hypothetical protein